MSCGISPASSFATYSACDDSTRTTWYQSFFDSSATLIVTPLPRSLLRRPGRRPAPPPLPPPPPRLPVDRQPLPVRGGGAAAPEGGADVKPLPPRDPALPPPTRADPAALRLRFDPPLRPP